MIMEIIFFLIIGTIWSNQSRSFYCLSENRCVTVWKRTDGYCYIIPGKYYGIFEPKDNYVKTDNLEWLAVVIWTKDGRLCVDVDNAKFVSQYSNEGLSMIEDYQSNKAKNDSTCQ